MSKYPKLGEIESIFEDMDLDGDKHISYDEVCDYIDERVGTSGDQSGRSDDDDDDDDDADDVAAVRRVVGPQRRRVRRPRAEAPGRGRRARAHRRFAESGAAALRGRSCGIC